MHLRIFVLLLAALAACITSPAEPAPVHAPAPSDSQHSSRAPPAESSKPVESAPTEPAAAEPVAESATTGSASSTAVTRWRFTTLVTGGPEPLIGANGYYELELVGDQLTVRKVGHKGTPRFAPHKILQGTGTLTLTDDPHWPGARRGVAEVILSNDDSRRTVVFDLWFWDEQLHGTWVQPHRTAGPPTIGRAWGLLEGQPGLGDPADLANGDNAPCTYCNRAFYNCEGMGEDGCNSSNMSIDDCNARMRRAKKKSRPLPRGCGDWM